MTANDEIPDSVWKEWLRDQLAWDIEYYKHILSCKKCFLSLWNIRKHVIKATMKKEAR